MQESKDVLLQVLRLIEQDPGSSAGPSISRVFLTQTSLLYSVTSSSVHVALVLRITLAETNNAMTHPVFFFFLNWQTCFFFAKKPQIELTYLLKGNGV